MTRRSAGVSRTAIGKLASLSAVVLALFPLGAGAETWPSRTVRALIPFGPGSATDVVPRIVFETMSNQIGHPIVVENRGGGGGTIGAAAVSKADPDGYTLLATSAAHTISPALYSNLPYDPARDFSGVGMIGSSTNVFIIAPSKGFKTIQEFVAAAKAKPNSMNFATVGVGSAVHISAERFRFSAGYDAVHIPFKGGAEALTEIVSGRVDYYFCPISTALPFIREGQVLALAVSAPTRSALLPDVPTTLELGYADSDHVGWYGVMAPVKTPAATVAAINTRLKSAIASAAVQERLGKIGIEPLTMTPAEMDARVIADIATYKAFAAKAGMKAN